MSYNIERELFGSMKEKLFETLAKRIGHKNLENRLKIQKNLSEEIFSHQGLTRFHPENIKPIFSVLQFFLKITGFKRRAERNSIDFSIEHNDIFFENLPESFDGFTILQLSDVHIDGFTDKGEALRKLLEDISCDLCVITGDFRFSIVGSYEHCMALTGKLVQSISCPQGLYGILGNHDLIEMTPELEAAGITMLINENIRIRKDEDSFVLAGVDDPHFHRTDDVEKALAGTSKNEFTVFLSHSPELYIEAEKMGVDFYLCGHTHGGQICLPNRKPIVTNASSPRKFASGAWNYCGMHGYTSRGTGLGGLPARFFCPPEVTVHRLLCSMK